MAKATNNILLRGVTGKLGGMVIRHMRDGSIRLCAPPDFRKRILSQAQKDHHTRFKQAAAYARQAALLEPVYEALARGTMKNAYNIALSDWFHPPVIHCIERRGEMIRVEASDNVMVAQVHVRILDADGQVLEEGEAIQSDPELRPEWWEYVSNTEGQPVKAEACDLAGNRAEVAWTPSSPPLNPQSKI
jgi:hypothetical protein